ncbi:MAG: hypothetical protein A2Y62_07770 [Candidatus Fischerbacteria bacterium RBG_13_37_8]|uniref:Cell division protein FtsX n=1 Tax=Candidatus Fischerbacteria bacterium RBG_13_37_8 TaxID=1817863 RepID=A0A1F5V920_9BACT|nr:MAG: hypothetical protein A2Y62_07770 [Candidatus Fischerbacteria bacterium RBG_13_37_8]
MHYLNIIYFIVRESVIYIWRNKTITFLSIAVTSFSLFVIAFFLATVENINVFIERVTQEISVNIFLADTVTPVQRQYIEKLLKSSDYVHSYEYIAKDKALNDFLRAMPNFESIVANLKENPIPSSYRVILKEKYNSENAIKNFIKIFVEAEGIEEIQYDRQWFEKLISFINIIKFGAIIIGAVLVFTALFTIANVIRLVVYGRKDEIEILRLVGASSYYIKGPFILEGVLQGMTAGVISLLALYGAYKILMHYIIASQAAGAVQLLVFLSSDMQISVVLTGVLIGFIGSFFSVSHLLVEQQ